jgi:RNA polymerase sigma-70 factor (ECF subfamily)
MKATTSSPTREVHGHKAEDALSHLNGAEADLCRHGMVTRTEFQCYRNSAGARVVKGPGCDRLPTIDMDTVCCQHYRRVFAWCSSLARRPEDAEDLAQEVFLTLARHIHSFRGEAALPTWLYRVVRATFLMGLRRKRPPETSLDGVIEAGGAVPWQRPERPLDAAKGQGWNLAIDLERAVKQLPAGQKTVVLLHDLEGYQHPEVAEILGVVVGTAKSQLHKARRRLREALQ